jgi:transposase
VEPMPRARKALLEAYDRLHKVVLDAVRGDEVCRRLMTLPGVGPVVALAFKTAVDVPARFQRSRTVGAHFGPTPRTYQSGETGRNGRISKIGDEAVRAALFEAANVLMTRVSPWLSLKAWAARLTQLSGARKACGRPGPSLGPVDCGAYQ